MTLDEVKLAAIERAQAMAEEFFGRKLNDRELDLIVRAVIERFDMPSRSVH